jgi:hypothetical protein
MITRDFLFRSARLEQSYANKHRRKPVLQTSEKTEDNQVQPHE